MQMLFLQHLFNFNYQACLRQIIKKTEEFCEVTFS